MCGTPRHTFNAAETHRYFSPARFCVGSTLGVSSRWRAGAPKNFDFLFIFFSLSAGVRDAPHTNAPYTFICSPNERLRSARVHCAYTNCAPRAGFGIAAGVGGVGGVGGFVDAGFWVWVNGGGGGFDAFGGGAGTPLLRYFTPSFSAGFLSLDSSLYLSLSRSFSLSRLCRTSALHIVL